MGAKHSKNLVYMNNLKGTIAVIWSKPQYLKRYMPDLQRNLYSPGSVDVNKIYLQTPLTVHCKIETWKLYLLNIQFNFFVNAITFYFIIFSKIYILLISFIEKYIAGIWQKVSLVEKKQYSLVFYSRLSNNLFLKVTKRRNWRAMVFVNFELFIQ